MIECEKCGESCEREEIETVRVPLRDKEKTQRPLDLCKATCAAIWDETAPGTWVMIGSEEVQRLYWPCDLCNEVYRYDGVKIMVRLVQAPPRTEYIVCDECQLKVKNSNDPLQWELQQEVGDLS